MSGGVADKKVTLGGVHDTVRPGEGDQEGGVEINDLFEFTEQRTQAR